MYRLERATARRQEVLIHFFAGDQTSCLTTRYKREHFDFDLNTHFLWDFTCNTLTSIPLFQFMRILHLISHLSCAQVLTFGMIRISSAQKV
jgi:hypothetical protein